MSVAKHERAHEAAAKHAPSGEPGEAPASPHGFAQDDMAARASADLTHLLACIDIGILFLDAELRVRRYSPRMTKILDLSPRDIGRSFAQLAHPLVTDELVADAERALRGGTAVERELPSHGGRVYHARWQSCRAADERTDAVVLILTDVRERQRRQEENESLRRQLEARSAYAEGIVATVREPLLVLDGGLRVITANRAFYRVFETTPEATEHTLLYELCGHQWDIPELRRLLVEVLPQRTTVESFEVHHGHGEGARIMLLNARRLRQPHGLAPLILLAFEDVTERARSQATLAASEEQYRNLFNSLDEGFCIIEMLYDEDGKPVDFRFVEVNPAFARHTSLSEVAGKTAMEVNPRLEGAWLESYDRVATTGASIRIQQHSESLHRWFDLYAFRVGRPEQHRVAVLFTDITAHKRWESEQVRLASIVDTSDDAIISKNLDGVVTSWNKAAEQMFGYTAEEAIGQPIITLIIPPDRTAEEEDILERLARGESLDHFETVRQRKDGSLVDVSVTISPLKDGERVVGASKIARDISERRRNERHRDLLIQELNHRVKNTLATVQSLAMQTFRGDAVREALDTFNARLLALSAAHNVLTNESWKGAAIRRIVRNALAAFSGRAGSRIHINGPDLRLRSAAALALAMALHELATNAAKYGALSNKRGTIAIHWSVSDEARPCFRLHWLEQGGPPVQPPAGRGFGSRLIEYGLAQDLGGTVKLMFNASGVECAIEAPLEEIREQDATP